MFINDEPNQEERIIKLRQELEKDGETIETLSDDIPPDLEEKLLTAMLQSRTAVPVSLWDLLMRAGLEIPKPDQLDDNALTSKLTEIVDGMASLNAYLVHTNHLSDRELYERLYNDTLPEKRQELNIECIYVSDCNNGEPPNYEAVDRDRFLPTPQAEKEHEC